MWGTFEDAGSARISRLAILVLDTNRVHYIGGVAFRSEIFGLATVPSRKIVDLRLTEIRPGACSIVRAMSNETRHGPSVAPVATAHISS